MPNSTSVIVKQTLSVQVYRYLRNTILAQSDPDLAMGKRILEASIAAKIGCSITPVREALNMLSKEGLVIRNSHASSVISYSIKEIHNLFTLRICLETTALRLAAPNLTAEDLEGMERSVIPFCDAHKAVNTEEIFKANRAFHDVFLIRSDNKMLCDTIKGFTEKLQMVRAPMLRSRHTEVKPPVSVFEHKALLEALQNNDVECAVAVLEQHIRRVEENVIRYYSE